LASRSQVPYLEGTWNCTEPKYPTWSLLGRPPGAARSGDSKNPAGSGCSSVVSTAGAGWNCTIQRPMPCVRKGRGQGLRYPAAHPLHRAYPLSAQRRRAHFCDAFTAFATGGRRGRAASTAPHPRARGVQQRIPRAHSAPQRLERRECRITIVLSSLEPSQKLTRHKYHR
jgi:hypothetical protein